MKEIGGYFEMEYCPKKHYHHNALKLNSARYGIEYILQVRKIRKIYVPYYICDSVIEILKQNKINIEYYIISESFIPIFKGTIKDDEVILIVNYFGLITDILKELSDKFLNIIIDNTQAFFIKPIDNIDTVYSARKFLGVSDGGYLYTNCQIRLHLEKDVSYDRYMYLLKRSDLGAESGYQDFIDNEELLNKQGMKEMSNVTSKILESLDYESIKVRREKNFKILNDEFQNINKVKIPHSLMKNGPMVYPLLIDKDIRQSLIKNKIFVATYWKDTLTRVDKESFEYYLTKRLLPIPVDQRYSEEDMQYIINIVKQFL